jgi:hypothetical protein
MYGGWKIGGGHTKEWMNKTKEFIDRAFSLANNGGMKCSCSRCRTLFVRTRGYCHFTFVRSVSCQAMRCEFIMVSQFVELYQ